MLVRWARPLAAESPDWPDIFQGGHTLPAWPLTDGCDVRDRMRVLSQPRTSELEYDIISESAMEQPRTHAFT